MSTRWHKVCLLLNFVSLSFSLKARKQYPQHFVLQNPLHDTPYAMLSSLSFSPFLSSCNIHVYVCVCLLYRKEIYLRLCFKRSESIEWCYKASQVKWNKETQTWVMMGWEWLGRSFLQYFVGFIHPLHSSLSSSCCLCVHFIQR